MVKPKQRSKAVDAAIKNAYAKLAQKHFERAETSIGSLSDLTALNNKGIVESTERMNVVEDYLEKAGAAATRWGFKI